MSFEVVGAPVTVTLLPKIDEHSGCSLIGCRTLSHPLCQRTLRHSADFTIRVLLFAEFLRFGTVGCRIASSLFILLPETAPPQRPLVSSFSVFISCHAYLL